MYNLFLKKDIERHDREESEIRRHLSIVGCLYIHTVQLSVNLSLIHANYTHRNIS